MSIKFSVLQTVASLHPSDGGPTRTVAHLTDALAAVPNVSVTLLCQSQTGAPVFAAANPQVNRRVHSATSALALKMGVPLQQALAGWAPTARPDLIHDNGLWVPVNHWVARAARGWNTPLIIQPHGMLEPWALNHKAWKKKFALALYQRRDLHSARLFVATAESEYQSIRALGLRQPVAVIPNGVEFPLVSGGENNRPASRMRTALFLSRVHPKKGLINLLQAWHQLNPVNWQLKIVGPDEGGHLAVLQAKVRELGIAGAVEFVSAVDGEEKARLYEQSDVFVLPTFSENFGVVIAEALVHGLPVITTRGAPWADLVTYRCGWWVDIGVEPLVQALREAISLSDEERHAMGVRGRAYVQRYNWDDIASQTIEVYRWILGQEPQPACVRTD